MIVKFEKLHPHKFLGGSNPYEAEAWLRQIKKLLDTSDIHNEQHRVTMAAFQMEGEADHWWEMIRSTRQVDTLTWRQFEDLFMEKYFPNSLRQEMIQEFLQLKQGKMSVTQYVNCFEALSRYASAIVANEEDKVRQFEWGLDTDIRRRLIAVQLSTYAQIVDRALIVERELADSKRIQNQRSRNNNQPRGGGPVRNTRNHPAPAPYARGIQQQHRQNRGNQQGGNFVNNGKENVSDVVNRGIVKMSVLKVGSILWISEGHNNTTMPTRARF
ncbi:uncharacterized protein LOC114280732 [Camellia sinensis]|uniref:uncharacterized protein LOC114280732 n=1 Tax=Camellia sinensis TaxID=4442 RepID=UPI001035C9DD|nr:uncharacterized protein LOC114280732 [Camellia sinensis]